MSIQLIFKLVYDTLVEQGQEIQDPGAGVEYWVAGELMLHMAAIIGLFIGEHGR